MNYEGKIMHFQWLQSILFSHTLYISILFLWIGPASFSTTLRVSNIHTKDFAVFNCTMQWLQRSLIATQTCSSHSGTALNETLGAYVEGQKNIDV